MLEIISLALAVTAGVFSFGFARGFVRRRLRFVDAIRSPLAPILAGGVAALVAWPLTILPLITGFTAAVFGIGAGLGTASGIKALKSGD
ncbi:MAG: hypothetical protein JNJ80_06645 [Gemmatimonadetes bacterium]|nr:hypothetical protein [Gemmatimonadota bacterium]MCC7131210.1 hypothetical protein [Gemmatimonadales bacterium]